MIKKNELGMQKLLALKDALQTHTCPAVVKLRPL